MQVRPQPVKLPFRFGAALFVTLFGAIVVGVAANYAKSDRRVSSFMRPDDFVLAGLACGGLAGVTWYLLVSYRHAAEEERRRVGRLSTALMSSSSTALSTASVLREALVQAERMIALAEKEFAERAFGPFWDAVDTATAELRRVQKAAHEVQREAARYISGLRGERHDFPDFPVNPRSLPSAATALDRLSQIRRLGERDFQFATILEQRRVGRSMVERVEVLERAFDESVEALRGSMDEGSDRILSAVEDLSNQVEDLS